MDDRHIGTGVDLAERIRGVREQIRACCDRVGRDPDTVTLLGVTKTHPAAVCQQAHSLGLMDLGENYVQEWNDKETALSYLNPPIRWHFIGHLQTNKVSQVVGRVHLIHTVDRPSLVDTLARRADVLGVQVPVLIQVNIAQESSKFGCSPSDAESLVRLIQIHSSLVLRGLMTIGPIVDDPEEIRPVFRRLRILRDHLADQFGQNPMCTWEHLSMGMSHDLGVAVEEGATILRVGTALFGQRRLPLESQ